MVVTADPLDRLRAHRMLREAPDAELQWLAAHGTPYAAESEQLLFSPGERITDLFILFSGRISTHIERAHGRRKVMEWTGGEVTGFLPYSRMGSATGYTYSDEPTEALVIAGSLIPELTRTCPEVTAILVHVMIDRARRFTSYDVNDQKALALGKVAAGLAHELNNPAAALLRSSERLAEAEGSDPLGLALGIARLDDDALTHLQAVLSACQSRPESAWEKLELADREDAIFGVLGVLGVDAELSAVLAESVVEPGDLADLSLRIPSEVAGLALSAVGREQLRAQLSGEIHGAAARICDLVEAVKRFTLMDQAAVSGPVDVNASVADAARLVDRKSVSAGVEVSLRLGDHLPPVHGLAGELNQMWYALIDNAVDAATPGGHVEVRSSGGGETVNVEVRDDGPGISDAHRDRIFEPFFTTKPVGEGAGLGLELVRRVLDHQRGDLDLETRPGRTVFRVRLPAGD